MVSAGPSLSELVEMVVSPGHGVGPNMKRARSNLSISKGVIHLIPKPMHALGILIFLVEAEAISWVTTV